MELPQELRQAVDAMLEGTSLPALRRASARLSQRYRAERRDGRLHVDDTLAARAYLATRLPATFAATRTAFAAVARQRPGFAPRTLIDVGAGPGVALWAGLEEWPELADAAMIEASGAMRAAGTRLGESAPVRQSWHAARVENGLDGLEPAALVTLGYVLDELKPAARAALIARLWALTRDTLVIVEPGTPAGWRRILGARERLIAAGGHIVAPCPHHGPCPLAEPDWCHFARRVARSRRHRQAKTGDVPWEDEKFIFLAVSRHRPAGAAARVLAPPKTARGMVRLKLCRRDGTLEERLVTRRAGPAFKTARKADWGDTF